MRRLDTEACQDLKAITASLRQMEESVGLPWSGMAVGPKHTLSWELSTVVGAVYVSLKLFENSIAIDGEDTIQKHRCVVFQGATI